MRIKKLIIFLSFLAFFPKLHLCYGGDQEEFRFAIIGCMHLGICDFTYYQQAMEKIKKYNPDFILFLGGMVDPSRKEPVKSQWEKFDLITQKINIPVYNVPSNCRLSFLSFVKNRESLLKSFFLKRFKKNFFAFKHKRNLFICLDSTTLFNPDTNREQLKFLKDMLSKSSQYNNIFVALHQSPWFQERNNKEWFKWIHPLLLGKVKYVFGSHLHYIDLTKIDDIIYVTSGVPPCAKTPYAGKSTFSHFLLVEVKGKKVAIKVVPIGDSVPIEYLGSSLIEDETSLLDLHEQTERHSQIKPLLLTSYEREFMLKPDKVINALKIRPGLKILDVGAGTGFFTFRFAEALKNTGEVLATDIDPEMIKFINKKMKKLGYKNIQTVLVHPNTVDSFYKQHHFDIIFLCEVYQYLRAPKRYFEGLRPSLKRNGRLYIINSKNIYDFTKIEFGNFKSVVKALILKGKDYPVFQKLSKEVQDFVKNWKGENVPSYIKKEIVRDFNRILLDRTLFYGLLDYYTSKGIKAGEGEWSAPLELVVYSEDLKLAKWLFIELESEGVFDSKKPLSQEEKRRLKKLNRLLLTRTFSFEKIPLLQGEPGPPIYVEKKSVISTMESAGYILVHEYSFLPYHYFLEFERKY